MPLWDKFNSTLLLRSDKKLGLVRVVLVPETSTNDVIYPTQACSFGVCKLLTTGALILKCPNGKNQYFGKCWQRIKELGGGRFTASCTNHPDAGCYSATPGQDGRAYNLAVKKPIGEYVVDNDGRRVTGAYYRVHKTTQSLSSTRGMTLGATLCAENDADSQMGCLPQYDKCSIGFASRTSINSSSRPKTIALDVNSMAPTQANIEALLAPGGTPLPNGSQAVL